MPMRPAGDPFAVLSRVYSPLPWLSFGKLRHPYGLHLFVGVGPFKHSCTISISLGARGILLPRPDLASTNAAWPLTSKPTPASSSDSG